MPEASVPAAAESQPTATAPTAEPTPEAPRLTIDTPKLSGSLSLAGGRIDDLLLKGYRETVDPTSPEVRLMSPVGKDHPYYAVFGWLAGNGLEPADVPDAKTQWSVAGNATLTQPLCRMVDPGLTEGMVEWVVGHALRHHLGLDSYIVNPNRIWNPDCPPLARDHKVAMLGIGALGEACARALQALHFAVECWSRAPKSLPGIVTHHGRDGLKAALQDADLIVTLLPRTPETENTLNAETLGWTKPGAVILNPGRGALIDDDALLDALDAGQVGHATLDVFRVEPLPQDHPFWAHPRVTVTPHIAADTRPDTSSEVIAENIRRGEANAPFLNLVDRTRGY